MTAKEIVAKWIAGASPSDIEADIQDAIEEARIGWDKLADAEKGKPDEVKAEIFIKRYWGHYGEEFRKSMIPPLVKLIRDEREECGRICDEADKSTHPADLANKIRARSN